MKKNKKRKEPELLICDTPYYVPDLIDPRGYVGYEWQNTDEDLRLFERKLVFRCPRDAQAVTDALLSAIKAVVGEAAE